MIGRLLKIGLPSALQFSVCAVGVMIVQTVINGMGSNTVAAYSVGVKIEQLVTQPIITLGIAIGTFSAQNLGAGRLDRIQKGVRGSVLLAILFSLFGMALVFLFGQKLANLFIEPGQEQVVGQTIQYLKTVSFFFIPLSMIFIFRNTTQGMGSGLIPMLSSIQELIFRALAAFTLPAFLGYAGICLASPMSWVSATVLLLIAYKLHFKRMQQMIGPVSV